MVQFRQQSSRASLYQSVTRVVLRIISGIHKGRVIQPPRGLPVRPTMDRTKESLFNILGNKIEWESTSMADLFSGTGNIALEACSRGAKQVVAVDSHSGCCRFIRSTAEQLDFHNIHVMCQDVSKWVKSVATSYDLIFLDPPYQMTGQAELVQTLYLNCLNPGGWLVLEHALLGDYSHLEGFQEIRSYGQSAFSFYHKPESI